MAIRTMETRITNYQWLLALILLTICAIKTGDVRIADQPVDEDVFYIHQQELQFDEI